MPSLAKQPCFGPGRGPRAIWPSIAAALNTILGRWGKKASPEWNISGELCSGFATDKTDWDYYPNINPFIKCDCTDSNNTLCHITRLRVTNLNVVGQIPTELQNLTHLVDLYGIQDFSS
uniref:Uncharacterized protein n=1 Tax=Oryza sativa subsp. japonica TaxID=39947 RepID=Q6ATA7_ORYSJ|nr:hypothetical protein [Oryza sativa Japonica Group]AAU44121.1 unknown protein [Oryza sativa Japonica Group]